MYMHLTEFDWPIAIPDVTSSCTQNLVSDGGFEALTGRYNASHNRGTK